MMNSTRDNRKVLWHVNLYKNLIRRDVTRGKDTRKISKCTIYYVISISLSSILLIGLIIYISIHLHQLKSSSERLFGRESSNDPNNVTKVIENETLPDVDSRLETHNNKVESDTTSRSDLETESHCKPINNSIIKPYRKSLQKCLEYQSKYVYPCRRSNTPNEGMVRMNHCNLKPEALIIGGEDAYLGEFPHMALLGYDPKDEYDEKWKCSGVLVSENFVLTAAHCTSTSTKKDVKYVRIGIQFRNETVTPSNTYTVKRTVRHPLYKSPLQYHDIALLETNEVMKFNRYAFPACLHGSPVDDSSVVATGWGTTKTSEYSTPYYLQKVTLTKYSDGECYHRYKKLVSQRLLRHLPSGFDKDFQVCYGDKYSTRDTCKGDSGGPTQIRHPQVQCMYQITSITSNGKWCGDPTTPGLYTQIPPYLDWIESIVWPDSTDSN